MNDTVVALHIRMSHSNVHMIGPEVYCPFIDYCPYCPMV